MKLRTFLTTAAAAVTIFAATPSHAGAIAWQHCSAKQVPKVELRCAERNRHRANTVLRWALHQRELEAAVPRHHHHRKLGIIIRDARWLQAASARKISEARYRMQPAYPPHHRLWTCIERYEGAWHDHDSGHNSHYGGLQMTWNWLGYISGDAGNYSQAEQEWAAERAWRDSGYSYSFLYGQWYEWDNADGCGSS